jgi:hypothetical protein
VATGVTRGEDAVEAAPAQEAPGPIGRVDEQELSLCPGGSAVQVQDDAESSGIADLGIAKVQSELTRASSDDGVDGVADVRDGMDVEAAFDDDIVTIGRFEHPDWRPRRHPTVGIQRHCDPSQLLLPSFMMTPPVSRRLPPGVKKASRKPAVDPERLKSQSS